MALYARRLGLGPSPKTADGAAAASLRDSILALLTSAAAPGAGALWPPRYAARRMAWHVLDQAWEMEDRSPAPSRDWGGGQT